MNNKMTMRQLKGAFLAVQSLMLECRRKKKRGVRDCKILMTQIRQEILMLIYENKRKKINGR